MVKRSLVFFILATFSITAASCSPDKKEPVQYENHKANDSQNKTESEAVNIIANDDRIIEMLKKNGEIPENATPEEIQEALQKYLKKKAPVPGTLQDEKAKQKYINELKEKIQKEKNGSK